MSPVGCHRIGRGDGTQGHRVLIGTLVAHDTHTANGGKQDDTCLPDLMIQGYAIGVDIFAQGSALSSEMDDIVQVGRNDYVNVYTAEIAFPKFEFNGKYVSFADTRYMIFGSDVMSQDADSDYGEIEPSANCMTYCNKTRRQFTAIYITYPDDNHLGQAGYNALNGGLVSNSFHCHIVGRWQEEQIQL